MKNRFQSFLEWKDQPIAYLVVGLTSFIYFFTLARLDPDMHHDGVQFAPAVGVGDGLRIHSDVYEQYGPITAWIQGATLKVFGFTLLNLRLETVVVLVIAALLLTKILFLLKVPQYVAILIPIVWALSCPASSIYPGVFGLWPWSSTFSLIFLLANSIAILQAQVQRRRMSSAEIYFCGVISGVILFTRFQVGLVSSLINFILIFLGIARFSQSKRASRTFKFLLSYALTVCLIALVLWSQGSMTSFIDQIIVGPLHQYVFPYSWAFFRMYYIWASLPTLLLIIIGTLVWRRFAPPYRAIALLVLAAIMATLMYIGNWRNGAALNRIDTPWALLDVQGISLMFSSVLAFLLLTFLGICFLFSIDFIYPAISSKSWIGTVARDLLHSFGFRLPKHRHFNSNFQRARREKLAILGTLLLLLFPFIVQLYPISDVYHLWWAAPLFMVLIPYTLGNFLSQKGVLALMAILLLPALVASTVMEVQHLRVHRNQVVLGALSGMQIEDQYIDSYNAVNAALRDVLPSSARFACRDGMIAAWDGSYSSIDAAYVDWAWVAKNPPTTTIPARIFFCGTPEAATAYAATNNLKIVGQGISYRPSFWSYGVFYEFSPTGK